MRMNSLPSEAARLTATRPASSWRAVIQPGCSDCSPYSPNDTSLPRVALPRMRPFCCLRYLTRLGISAIGLPHALVFALVDPGLHADDAVGGARDAEAVVHLGIQGLQRDRAHDELLAPRHLRATQATGHVDLHAQRARLDRELRRLLHRAAERHAL